MKTFSTVAAQGELRIRRLTAEEANRLQKLKLERVEATDGHLVVGHSETGHHHVVDGNCATLHRLPSDYMPDAVEGYLLNVMDETALRHLREFDTHESILLSPDAYKVVRQREYTPEGLRASAD